MDNILKTLTAEQRTRIDDEVRDAYDFDPRDPLFGLSRNDLSGSEMKRRTVLRLLAAGGTLTALQLVPGVLGGSGELQAAGKAGGTLTCGWAGVGEIRTIDPAQINQVLQFQIASNVLSGLMHIDASLVGKPDLTEGFEVSSDGTEYTFKLREGVTFHNGDKFTADDVLFTYNRSKDPKKSIHSRILKNVKEVTKVNDYTVKFKLGRAQASFLTKTLERASGRAMTIVSRGGIEKLGVQQYGLTPVGTGPFKITFHELGQGVILEKNENYYDPSRPKLDKVIIKPIIAAEPLAAAIEAGDIKLIGGNPPAAELIDRFKSNPDLVVKEAPGPGFQAVWMNPHRDPFKVADFNVPLPELMKQKGFKVRLAIAKALDRERYLKQARFGRGYPAYGSINPAMGYYFDENLGDDSNQKFDVKEAQKLLAEAGFPGGKGFPELTLGATVQNRRDAQVVASILKRNLGIKVKVETKDSPVLLQDFLAMRYDMMRIGSGGDYDPDDGVVDWMQTNSKFNGAKRDKSKMKFGYWSEDEADKLIATQSVEANVKERKALVQKANKITSDKVACAFLYHPMDIKVWHKSVNVPAESLIPALVDLDRTTLS
ncbi:MAG: ABC transporter substrate-binding protein [Rhodospirillaceae bacterium]|jgi:ABC-type transport system substrate-binding protein|nr:ABC transporter substrate-binding protein [Rhodospirillaceae bacterium]